MMVIEPAEVPRSWTLAPTDAISLHRAGGPTVTTGTGYVLRWEIPSVAGQEPPKDPDLRALTTEERQRYGLTAVGGIREEQPRRRRR
jgi:hypothetical protein